MRRIAILAAALAAVGTAVQAASAATDPVPFPAPKVEQVFVAGQTVTPTGAMASYFAPGSTVVFRAYAVNPKTKQLVAAKAVKYFYVAIPGQSNIKLAYDASAPGASKGFPWAGSWTVPASYTPGRVAFKILIKLKSKAKGQFVQLPVPTSMLTVASAPPAVFTPAPAGAPGLVDTSGKVDLSLYVDSVNGSRPVGTAPRQIGCAQTNVYKRGEQVVFRVWGSDLATNDVLSNDNVDTATASIPGQKDVTLAWGAHGNTDAKVYFWSAPWIVPADFPLGDTTVNIAFKTLDGKTGTFAYTLNIIP
jgi:hypothetical protein